MFRALQSIDDLVIDLEEDSDPDPQAGANQRELLKTAAEFAGYIRVNVGSIPNYGERHRAGEIISTSFVESAVNQVINKRMVKRQQMRWTPKGAHLLRQIRTGCSTATSPTTAAAGTRTSPTKTQTITRSRRSPPTVCPALPSLVQCFVLTRKGVGARFPVRTDPEPQRCHVDSRPRQ